MTLSPKWKCSSYQERRSRFLKGLEKDTRSSSFIVDTGDRSALSSWLISSRP